MVWFSEDILTPDMIMMNYLERLRSVSLDEGDEDIALGGIGGGAAKAAGIGAGDSASLAVSRKIDFKLNCDFKF